MTVTTGHFSMSWGLQEKHGGTSIRCLILKMNSMFDFKTDCIKPEGMHAGWQTSGTVKVCHLAFNLWNGYTEEGRERYFTPEELFCCEFAPYFMEGIKVRYPEYCRELPAPKKQNEYAR